MKLIADRDLACGFESIFNQDSDEKRHSAFYSLFYYVGNSLNIWQNKMTGQRKKKQQWSSLFFFGFI